MNRRTMLVSSFAALALPASAIAQTPSATPMPRRPEDDPVDSTTRDLTDALLDIRPLALLEALEVAEVTNPILAESAGERPIASRPWADYGDTDLHHSLGGVALTLNDLSLHDTEAEMLGAYIVYESAEIAYQELLRKLGPLADTPEITMSSAGVNVWVISSDDVWLGITRVGYIQMMGLMKEPGDPIMSGMIEHLAEVAASV